jgi:hypothetical protein
MLDKTEYKQKPSGSQIAAIQYKLKQTDISIEQLANKLINGCTFKPALLSGKSEENWISQQLFALDFDENTTIQLELDRCSQLNILPCFGYTSFSHMEDHHKFRLVFCSEEVIADYDSAKNIQLSLMKLFINCDNKCKNLSRLFFGGKKLIDSNYDATFNHKELLEICGFNVQGFSPHNSNKINTFINIVGGKTPSTENYNIKAISTRDSTYLKEKLNRPKIIFQNNQQFCDYIFKEIHLAEFLEIKYPKGFKCLFHEDASPSATIFKSADGYWYYHCYGCGVWYNLLNVIEKLGKFKSRPKAYRFIREIFNIEIQESEWAREQKEMLLENLKIIENGELEKNCPVAYGNIARNLKYLRQYMLIGMDNIYNENLTDNDDNSVFFASARFMCKQLGIKENGAKEISKKNILFQYHGLLNKLADENIPEKLLKHSQAIDANNEIKNSKHINFFSIPSFTTDLFEEIERQGIKWRDNNYSMTGCSREMFFRTEGKKIADWLYPQFKEIYDVKLKQIVDRTTSDASDCRTIIISQYIIDRLNNAEYVTEKDIIEYLIKYHSFTKKSAQIQLKKSEKEIFELYGFTKLRCNKELKLKYNIGGAGFPSIIINK